MSAMGFSEFLNSIRIDHACVWLLNGYSVKDTVALCGFTDKSYFIKVFKRFRGVTPRVYLEKNKEISFQK